VPYFPAPPLAVGGRTGQYVFEHRAVDAGSLDAHTFDADVLMLSLGAQAVRFRSRLNGRQVSGLIEPECLRFLARGDTLSTSWDAPVQGLFLTLTPAFLAQSLGDDIDRWPMELLSQLLPHQDLILCHLLKSIAACFAGSAANGHLFEQLLLTATAVHVQTRYSTGRHSHRCAQPLPRWKQQRLAEYIRTHLGQPLNLNDLAAVAGLSPYHLARAYKASTGSSLWQTVLQARVAEARRVILARTDLPLAVIAKDCGFDSYRQFIAAFRKFFGLLPGEYRNSLRTN
jgi:AraC family transcriptional regulator